MVHSCMAVNTLTSSCRVIVVSYSSLIKYRLVLMPLLPFLLSFLRQDWVTMEWDKLGTLRYRSEMVFDRWYIGIWNHGD